MFESLPGWYGRRTRAWHNALEAPPILSSWSEPLGHSTKYSFMVLHTDIMHKSTIYSMYGGPQEGQIFPEQRWEYCN